MENERIAENIANEEQAKVIALGGVVKDTRIASAEDYTAAGNLLRDIQRRKKEVEEKQSSIMKPLLAAQRNIRALFRPPLDLCAVARGIIDSKMSAWRFEQEEKRRKEEAHLREIARKEQHRLDRLAAKKAEKAAAKGNEVKAMEIIGSVPVIPTPVVVAPPPPKVAGVSVRKVWRFRIVNAALIPREWLSVDEKRIGQYVRAAKGDANIPGVEVYYDEVSAVGA